MKLRASALLKGVIFDLDGTLANTQLDFPRMCIDAGLPVGTKLLEHCTALTDKNRAREIMSVIERHELDGAKRAEWILDAEQVLNRLDHINFPMAIVTRNMRTAAEYTIEKLNIPIDLLVTREDCLPKPHPEGLLMVAKKWGVLPENLAYVGDYQFDLIAANSAGMVSCLLSNHRNEQFHHQADKIIDNFQQLESIFNLK